MVYIKSMLWILKVCYEYGVHQKYVMNIFIITIIFYVL